MPTPKPSLLISTPPYLTSHPRGNPQLSAPLFHCFSLKNKKKTMYKEKAK
jgi:hypothetical protein